MKLKGKFRLNSTYLLREAKKRGVKNRHQIALRSGVTRATGYGYLGARHLRYVDISVLFAILDGIGFTPEEMKELRFLDVFIQVEAEDVSND